jgi:orotidine-5'-phosphate decarboxylase
VVSPVLVALDFSDLKRAEALARDLVPHVGGFKVGLELIMSEGPRAVASIADLGLPVFADAKLHDIPNTVVGAARALGRHGARWVTVHPGGQAMVEAAVGGLREGSDGIGGILVVTVLTSLSDRDLSALGFSRNTEDQVAAMASLAAAAGAEGVVCSPVEIAHARRGAPGLTVVTPGVRPVDVAVHDQKRTATPEEALAAGADWLVVGRPITAADDPVSAARDLRSALHR